MSPSVSEAGLELVIFLPLNFSDVLVTVDGATPFLRFSILLFSELVSLFPQ